MREEATCQCVAPPLEEDHAFAKDGRARCFAFHPYVFAAAPVLMLYVHNFHKTPFSDVLAPLVVVLGAALITLFLFRLVFPGKQRAAIGASYLLLLTLLYGPLKSTAMLLLLDWGDYLRHRYALGAWCAALVIGLVWLRRARFDDGKATRLLNTVSMMFIITSVFVAGYALAARPPRAESENALNKQEEPETWALQRPALPRDVYLLVFDRCASSEILKELYGYDDTGFRDRLRKRGFYCLTDARTNYPRTCFSMASVLNMRYHGDAIQSMVFYEHEIRNHTVGRLFKDLGYKYYHVGNFHNPLRFNKNADFNYRARLLPSEFADNVYQMTPLCVFPLQGDPFISQQETLERISGEAGPKFVYVHFLTHHHPESYPDSADPYVAETKVVNDSILEMVDEILERSKVPPIIVIQADEGPVLTKEDMSLDYVTQVRKRTGIISAFCLPGVDPAEKIPVTMSPVNTFRLIFKEYFSAHIDLLEDRTFYWENETWQPRAPGPGPFIDVTGVVSKSLSQSR
jgi:hypothetical protein